MDKTIKDFIPEKPTWKWSYLVPFTAGRKHYKVDRRRYDKWYYDNIMTMQEKLRKKQSDWTNGLSALLLLAITTVWSVLPPLVDLPKELNFMYMGMDASNFGWGSNWGNQLMLTLMPGLASTGYQQLPKIAPEKIKFFVNLSLKLVPVILLCLCYVFIKWEKEIHKLNKMQKQAGDSLNLVKIATGLD